MGARMGIRDTNYNPYKGISLTEQGFILKTNIYPYQPLLPEEDWNLLKAYILKLAPDSLPVAKAGQPVKEQQQFKSHPISLDTIPGTLITFLEFDKKHNSLLTGDLYGNLYSHKVTEKKSEFLKRYGSGLTAYSEQGGVSYATVVGYLDPSEVPSGRIITINEGNVKVVPEVLHRPVHTLVHDFNKDGTVELVVSEFGDLTGQLSLLTKSGAEDYKKTLLLPQPGAIRIVAHDMDKDGKDDIVVLTSQGNEGITILYQKQGLKFSAEQCIRFSPVYGSSWFELVDYDGDGDMDIITVNGDNADKSYVPKPYHGLRVYLNNGSNVFEEKYFYAMNGATRVVADDFDQDGDIDFGVISTFPDYENKPECSFVYLENTNAAQFNFEPYALKDANLGRWFLMDKGDIDADGDKDIILSSFTYLFTPVPEAMSKFWKEKNVDIMVLENTLKTGNNVSAY
jgi:hypothetical protein